MQRFLRSAFCFSPDFVSHPPEKRVKEQSISLSVQQPTSGMFRFTRTQPSRGFIRASTNRSIGPTEIRVFGSTKSEFSGRQKSEFSGRQKSEFSGFPRAGSDRTSRPNEPKIWNVQRRASRFSPARVPPSSSYSYRREPAAVAIMTAFLF